jgi:hypothetical protein
MLEALEIKEKEFPRDCLVEKGGGMVSWCGTRWIEERWVLGLLWVSGKL